MKRRQFIALLGGATAWPLAARAQQQGKIPRIGIIDDAPMWNAFRQGLRDLGYLEGQNIAFEYRTADGVPERLAEAATDLARRPVDVIATYGTAPSIAAKAATTTIPIVMIAVGDVVRTGLVQGLAHPGGNITGNTVLGPEVQPKRLQLFKAAVPALSRVALLWNPDNASHRLTAEEVRAAAATLSMTFTVVPVRRAEELDGALAAMMLERPEGLMVTIHFTSSMSGGSSTSSRTTGCRDCSSTERMWWQVASCRTAQACPIYSGALPAMWTRFCEAHGQPTCPWSNRRSLSWS
jgi:putative ABC transport system substrate-binding protein